MIKELLRWDKKKKKDESLLKGYPSRGGSHLLIPELKIKGWNVWWMYVVYGEGWIYFFKMSRNLSVGN